MLALWKQVHILIQLETNKKKSCSFWFSSFNKSRRLFIVPWYESVVESSKLRTSDAEMFNLDKIKFLNLI